jgi:adenylate cyclase
MSDDPEQEYFTDGITEEIITALSKIQDLFVIARNSTFTYKGKPVKVKQVAEEFGVRYVLEGSVRKSEDRVRITAQLIDALTGRHLWSERYDRDLKDILALQDEITLKIVSSLEVKLIEGDQARVWGNKAPNLDVYLKVMQARSLVRKGTRESLIRYGQIGKEIVDMAPEFPNGYLHLALYNWNLAMGGESPRESIAKAFKMAKKALTLDESFAIAHAIIGQVYLLMREYEKAIAAGERAVELEPNGPDGHVFLGSTLGYAGRLDEAIGHINQGIRLNPFPSSWYFRELGRCYRQKGQYEEALKAYKKGLQRNPEDIITQAALASVYALLDRQDEAKAAAKKVLEIDPHFNIERASKAWPYKNPADLKIAVDALRKAGLK